MASNSDNSDWYYWKDDVESGPMSYGRLKELLAANKRPIDTFIRRAADLEWTAASDLAAIAPESKSAISSVPAGSTVPVFVAFAIMLLAAVLFWPAGPKNTSANIQMTVFQSAPASIRKLDIIGFSAGMTRTEIQRLVNSKNGSCRNIDNEGYTLFCVPDPSKPENILFAFTKHFEEPRVTIMSFRFISNSTRQDLVESIKQQFKPRSVRFNPFVDVMELTDKVILELGTISQPNFAPNTKELKLIDFEWSERDTAAAVERQRRQNPPRTF